MRGAILASVAALALSGCASKITATDAATLIEAFHAAGCGGSILADIRGGTGQLGGSASGAVTVQGSCPSAGVDKPSAPPYGGAVASPDAPPAPSAPLPSKP